MTEPGGAKAAFRKAAPAEVGLVEKVFNLNLRVTDPDVLAELSKREGDELLEFANTALRIGVLALRQATGVIDAQALRGEGERLVDLVEGKLNAHAKELKARLDEELGSYFDPTKGHFPQRVKELMDEKGGLAGLLKRHLDGDTSTLAISLAKAVGDNSPLMKHLSPKQKDGLVETIARVVQERLEEQSKRVLDEFDLNNEDSALNRLIGKVNEISNEIGEQFNPEEEQSALARLNRALEQTRKQISKDLTLDDEESALSRLHISLREQIDGLLRKQAEFQQAISEQLGIKQVQDRTTEGGFSFEHMAGEALKTRIFRLGDAFESVGEIPGLLKRKTGDHLQTMGAESAAAGGKIVYECKRDKRYRVKVALGEMEEARKNRESEVGVFVMSAATVRENADLKAEYPPALTRIGNDILVVWDSENAATDVVLDAAIGLARALVVRAKYAAKDEEREELEDLNKAIADIEKQAERFDKMMKWCDDISDTSDNLKEELSKLLKRLRLDVRALNEGVKALKNTDA